MEDILKQLDGKIDGEGELLEDFVLTATEVQVFLPPESCIHNSHWTS